MKGSDILYQNDTHWVIKHNNLYTVFKDGITHATSVGDCGWKDLSLAIAYCNYQEKRRNNNGI